MDSTFSRYSPGFYHFLVLTLILQFFGNRSDSFSILARILRFPSNLLDSTIFRYSHSFDPFLVCAETVFSILVRILPFPGTRPDSTFSRYSLGFYHFAVLRLILPFFGTRPDSFSVLARILAFPGTRPDSSVFRS